MRIRLGGLAAILVLGASLSGCAAGMGTVAGNVIGGAAWGAMKGGALAWKGGSYAAKTTGKVAVGAAKGVRNEFGGQDASLGDAQGQVSEDTALANRAKDAAPVASADGHGATFAD